MRSNQTIFCRITCCLALTTAGSGLIWFFTAFISAENPVLTADLPVTWAVALLIYLTDMLILKKERPVFVPVAVDILMAAVLYGGLNYFFYGDSFRICFMMCLCIICGVLVQIYREMQGCGDETLIHMSQVLLGTAVIQLVAADYMGVRPGWAVWTGILAAACLSGALSVKHSGIKKTEKNNTSAAEMISVAGAAGVLTVVSAAAVLTAGPLSRAVTWAFDGAVNGVKAVLGAVYSVLAWLSEKMKPKMAAGFEEGYGFGGQEEWEEPEYGEIDPEMAKVLFAVILVAVAAIGVWQLWQVLSARNRVMKPVKMTAAVKIRGKVDLLQYLVQLWTEFSIVVRGKILMARHPGSIAAILSKLEKAALLNPRTRRRSGETAREFILRLAQNAETAGNEEFCRLLVQFAEEADAAFYGREKNIFKEFTQHKKMLKTLKNSLTTRV